ncbi:MAG: NAD(P)-dependent dehydrogenase (short-subunit alcohol dehydrogenase family) [Cryomorphaceae bacterium]|jgi:NAD(P)-dependent dehydrogenase (short-subunit alcohol dehydrogenase family)
MNKKVLITGAGSGLGKALALRYAKHGAQVCVADVDPEGGQAVTQLINDAGGTAIFLPCDITKQWDVDKLVMTLAERWQSIDMLINNAGVATAGMLESESMEQWQWVIDINLLGQVRMTKACLALLRESNSADKDIINIASQAGLTTAPGMGSYSVTKAAMVSLSETAHLELAHEGIHVSVVCPAFFETNLNKSLRSSDAGMQNIVNKMAKKSTISADRIAQQILTDVKARKFMVITHKDGLKAYRLKRFLPIERYLKIVKERTKRFVNKID